MKDIDTVIKELSYDVGDCVASEFVIEFVEKIIESTQISDDDKRVFRSSISTQKMEDALHDILGALYQLRAFEYIINYTTGPQSPEDKCFYVTLSNIDFDVLKNIKAYLEI